MIRDEQKLIDRLIAVTYRAVLRDAPTISNDILPSVITNRIVDRHPKLSRSLVIITARKYVANKRVK